MHEAIIRAREYKSSKQLYYLCSINNYTQRLSLLYPAIAAAVTVIAGIFCLFFMPQAAMPSGHRASKKRDSMGRIAGETSIGGIGGLSNGM